MRDAKSSIRGQYLRAILWVALSAAIAFAIVEGSINFEAADTRAVELQTAEARLGAEKLERFLGPLEGEIKLISQQAWNAYSAPVESRKRELRRLLVSHPELLSARVFFDTEGVVLTVTRTGFDNVEASRLPTLRTSTGFSDVQLSANGLPVVEYVAADTYEAGVVSVYDIDLRFVGETLQGMKFGESGKIFVVDGRGRLIGHPESRVLMAQENSEWAKAIAAHQNSADGIRQWSKSASLNIEGTTMSMTGTYVPRTRWWVVAFQNASEVRLQALKPVIRTTLVFVLIGALVMFASRNLATGITKPIRVLSEKVKTFTVGDTVADTPPTSILEIHELSVGIGEMMNHVNSSQATLEQRVRDKTAELARANRDVETASRHKSEFLAHMSHELRTPLNAVIGFSDLLKAQYFGPLNQKQSEYVRDINASGQHLLSLINDILDLAKVEAGRMELVLVDCHVATLVESCVSLVSERVSRSQQALTTDVSPEVATWPLDERKVKQCLLNLLTNASKFTPEGGAITLRVWVQRDKRDEHNELVAAVSDNGVGIAAEDLPKLFSEFYQAKAADDAAGVAAQREGTGLGLALTKGFVELHGGTISVESAVGKGSTFTMRFPGPADSGVGEAELAHADKVESAK